MIPDEELDRLLMELADREHGTHDLGALRVQTLTAARNAVLTTAPVRAQQRYALRGQRRALAPLLAVAAVVVLVVVGVTMLRGGHATSSPENPANTLPSHPAPSSSSPATAPTSNAFDPRQPVFALDPSAGFRIDTWFTSADVQWASVGLSDRRKAEIDILVYRPGTFDASQVHSTTSITVQGKPAIRGRYTNPDSQLTGEVIAWQYASDAWAMVTDLSMLTDGATPQEELRVADGVRFGGTAQLPVPFRLSYLPDGLTVATASSSTAADGKQAAVGFSDGRPGAADRPAMNGSALTVSITGQGPTPYTDDGATHVDINGHPGYLRQLSSGSSAAELIVDYGNGGLLSIDVDREHGQVYGDADLIRIARGIQLTGALADTARWIPVTSALPQ